MCVVPVLELATFAAGIVAGVLGALLGIGGGVLLVPLLNAGFGLPFREAAAASLVAVLATSAAQGARSAGLSLLNPRLAIVLLMFSALGATWGTTIVARFSDGQSGTIFGATAAVIAAAMLLRLDRRNVIADPSQPEGRLGGRFVDLDTGLPVVYRVRRVPVACAVSAGAGAIASFVGVGGGILIVPALNAWCGVPMRAAAATSAFMIGITALPGALWHYSKGYLGPFDVAGAAAIGVVIGFQAGAALGPRADVRRLKTLMAAILAVVAIEYLFVKRWL
jgi:uncharacterized membrane protein YfcA